MKLYFIISATAENPADAIAEARELAEYARTSLSVEVRRCGTGDLIANVNDVGTVAFGREEEDTIACQTD